MADDSRPAARSGTFPIGGDLPVHRLDFCEAQRIGFIPWFPLATGNLASPGGRLASAAERLDATPSQVALAWLLHRSPVMLPIPGTSRVEHLEENTRSALLELDQETVRQVGLLHD